jgi:hypothetical protein
MVRTALGQGDPGPARTAHRCQHLGRGQRLGAIPQGARHRCHVRGAATTVLAIVIAIAIAIALTHHTQGLQQRQGALG